MCSKGHSTGVHIRIRQIWVEFEKWVDDKTLGEHT